VALLDHGTFTEAARHLGLSQSTVSGHVADLERRLGVRVVERGRGAVRVTEAGRALVAPARQTLLAERGARRAVEELKGLLRGQLAVGGSTIPAVYLLPALFQRFHEAHPAVSLRTVTGDSQQILDKIRHVELEIGIVGLDPEDDGLETAPAGSDRLLLVMRPDHPLARKRSVSVADVVASPVVLREPGSGTRATTLRALAAAGVKLADLDVAAEAGSTEALRAFAREGLGLAFLSSLAVAEDLERGALATVPVQGVDVVRPFFLVTRDAALLSPAARAFRDLVRPRP
jgi:DNA-binding transcriptional LysR family regulator